MLVLIQFFVELCLLRKAPQDLPASSALLGTVLVVDLLAGMLLGSAVGLSAGLTLAEGLVEVIFTLALLYGALQMLNRLPRFQQTATALLGAGALLGVLGMIPLSLLPTGAQNAQSGVAALLFLLLIGWSILVTGHILRHAFDLRLGQGVVIAVFYNLLAYSLVSGLFSGS